MSHEIKQTIHIDRFYPDHIQRTASKLFERSRIHLIKELNKGCEVCNTKEKLECHHFHCEWADSNDIDWDKMKKFHPKFDWTTFTNPEDFVDSEYNMMILCETHHRGIDHGIHCLPFPDWIAQKNKKDDFAFAPDELNNNKGQS